MNKIIQRTWEKDGMIEKRLKLESLGEKKYEKLLGIPWILGPKCSGS